MSIFSKSVGVGPYYTLPITLPDGVLLPLTATRPGITEIDIY